MNRQVPAVLLAWESFAEKLFLRTKSFPKHARFTFAQRLDTLVLDTFELLVAARFQKVPVDTLQQVNLKLELLRLLLRLSFKRRFLSESVLYALVQEVDEVGRMVGGWNRSYTQT